MMNMRIEAIQYTPGCEPVLVQYSADTGPMARSTLFHTTQAALTARANGGTWNDKHVLEALEEHLATFALPVEVPLAVELRRTGMQSAPSDVVLKPAEPTPAEPVSP